MSERKQYKSKKEIYEDYPNLEALNDMELIVMRKELQKYPEDKDMLWAVESLLKLIILNK